MAKFGVRRGLCLAAGMLLAAAAVKTAEAAETAEWLVRFEQTLPPDLETKLDNALRLLAAGAARFAVALPDTWRLHLPAAIDEAALRAALAAVAPVRYVEPNWRWRPVLTPNDTYFDRQWGLKNDGQALSWPSDPADGYRNACDSDLNDGREFCDLDPGLNDVDSDATLAWDTTIGVAGVDKVRIAVVDSGISKDHPDFNPSRGSKIWQNTGDALAGTAYAAAVYGWDACADDGEPEDDYGHGTQVAGIIAAEGNDAVGVAGVVWDAEIVPVKFLGAKRVGGTDDCETTSAAIDALEFARLVSADVVNMSWGDIHQSQALLDKLTELAEAGIVLIAAAGNEGHDFADEPFYPAAYQLDELLSVAAHTNDDQLASFSNYGETVSLAAPGAAIFTDDVPWTDVWNFQNFKGYPSPGTTTLPPGPIAGTNFSVSGSNAKWGIGQYVSGTKVLIGDIEAADLDESGTPAAHGANLQAIITSDIINPASWGAALLAYTLAYDLGTGASFVLQYSLNNGSTWTEVDGATYTGQGAAWEYFLDLREIIGAATSLRVRFVLTTANAFAGSDQGFVRGGVNLSNVAWQKAGSDFAEAYLFSQGTSLAAPFVAGAAALVMGLSPNLRAADVVAHLRRTAATGDFGGRVMDDARLDIAAALGAKPVMTWAATEPTTSVTSPTDDERPGGGGGCGCRVGAQPGGFAEAVSTLAIGILAGVAYRRRWLV